MKKLKESITLKFIIGICIITIITLLLQSGIILLLHTIRLELTLILLLIIAIIVPLFGFKKIINKTCNEEHFKSINLSYLLTKILIISFVIMIIVTVFIAYKLHFIGNSKDGIYILSNGLASVEMVKYFEPYQIEMIKLDNLEFLTKCIIASTIYISFLILICVNKFINDALQITKEKKLQLKQFAFPVILIIIFIAIELITPANFSSGKNNVQVSFTITTERGLSDAEKNDINNKIKQIDKIIDYEYISNSSRLEELNEKTNNLLSSYANDNPFPDSYKIIVNYKDETFVKEKLMEIPGIEKN